MLSCQLGRGRGGLRRPHDASENFTLLDPADQASQKKFNKYKILGRLAWLMQDSTPRNVWHFRRTVTTGDPMNPRTMTLTAAALMASASGASATLTTTPQTLSYGPSTLNV